MSTAQRVWLTPHAHHALRNELTALLSLARSGSGQDETVLSGRERDDRIREIHDLLANAVVGEDPPDDGVAEPGMVLTVRFDDTGETEIFLLGVRAAEHGTIEVYSPQSPLGAAVNGVRRGERFTYGVPSGATVRATLLEAVPYSRAARHRRFSGPGAPRPPGTGRGTARRG